MRGGKTAVARGCSPLRMGARRLRSPNRLPEQAKLDVLNRWMLLKGYHEVWNNVHFSLYAAQ